MALKAFKIGKLNGWYVVGGAGGVGLVIYLYKRSASGGTTAAGSSTIDPATGLPTSEDNTTDPLTGMTYLAEAQQYGSVSAAEAAVQGNYSSVGGGNTGILDSGYPTGYGYPGNTVPTGNTYSTNSQWAQAVTAGLVDLGYSSTDVAAALGLYFQSHPLGSGSDGVSYLQIMQAAVAEFGPPPVGTFPLTGEPTNNNPPPPTTTTKVTVPKVISQTGQTARQTLTGDGFKVTQVPASLPVPKGEETTVTSQSPAGGTKAAKGSTVTIHLSLKKLATTKKS